MSNAYKTLDTVEGLLDRMCALMECADDSSDKEARINSVLDKMWQFNQTYSFRGNDRVSWCYLSNV